MAIIDVEIELLDRHGQQMHHITDVKIKNPVIWVLNS